MNCNLYTRRVFAESTQLNTIVALLRFQYTETTNHKRGWIFRYLKNQFSTINISTSRSLQQIDPYMLLT